MILVWVGLKLVTDCYGSVNICKCSNICYTYVFVQYCIYLNVLQQTKYRKWYRNERKSRSLSWHLVMVRLLAVRYKLKIEYGHGETPNWNYIINILFTIIIFNYIRIIILFLLSLTLMRVALQLLLSYWSSRAVWLYRGAMVNLSFSTLTGC